MTEEKIAIVSIQYFNDIPNFFEVKTGWLNNISFSEGKFNTIEEAETKVLDICKEYIKNNINFRCFVENRKSNECTKCNLDKIYPINRIDDGISILDERNKVRGFFNDIMNNDYGKCLEIFDIINKWIILSFKRDRELNNIGYDLKSCGGIDNDYVKNTVFDLFSKSLPHNNRDEYLNKLKDKELISKLLLLYKAFDKRDFFAFYMSFKHFNNISYFKDLERYNEMTKLLLKTL